MKNTAILVLRGTEITFVTGDLDLLNTAIIICDKLFIFGQGLILNSRPFARKVA